MGDQHHLFPSGWDKKLKCKSKAFKVIRLQEPGRYQSREVGGRTDARVGGTLGGRTVADWRVQAQPKGSRCSSASADCCHTGIRPNVAGSDFLFPENPKPPIGFFLNKFIYFTYFYKFIYLWLRWVFVAAHRLSLVAASGGSSSLRCAGFSLRWLLLLRSTGSKRAGFSSCGTRAQ